MGRCKVNKVLLQASPYLFCDLFQGWGIFTSETESFDSNVSWEVNIAYLQDRSKPFKWFNKELSAHTDIPIQNKILGFLTDREKLVT